MLAFPHDVILKPALPVGETYFEADIFTALDFYTQPLAAGNWAPLTLPVAGYFTSVVGTSTRCNN
jgi:hypothetical protein